MITVADLQSRFEYHPPQDSGVVAAHQTVRTSCLETAQRIVAVCPESRELSLALTKIEEAMMWANAAIARHQADPGDPDAIAEVKRG